MMQNPVVVLKHCGSATQNMPNLKRNPNPSMSRHVQWLSKSPGPVQWLSRSPRPVQWLCRRCVRARHALRVCAFVAVTLECNGMIFTAIASSSVHPNSMIRNSSIRNVELRLGIPRKTYVYLFFLIFGVILIKYLSFWSK